MDAASRHIAIVDIAGLAEGYDGAHRGAIVSN